MILSRHDGVLRLVQQNEHGRLAGLLAGAWGNGDDIEAPRPGPSVVTAAARHDEGWRAPDSRVLYDEVARRPLHFLDVEAGAHIRLYRQGVTTVNAADVYAGLLVGMHWTGLYRSRWMAPGGGSRIGQVAKARAAQDRVVRSEQRRWADATELAWTEREPRAAFEARLWHNYELLQLWDLLSLFLSVVPAEPGQGEAAPWGPQLRDLEHEARPVLLPAVGAWPGGPRFAVTATVSAPGVVAVDPFPFGAPVELEVEHVVIPDQERSMAATRRAVRHTSPTATSWRLVPSAPRRPS